MVEQIALAVLGGLGALLSIAGIVDGLRKTSDSWVSARQGRGLWLGLLGAGILVPGLGLLTGPVYFFRIRPRIAAFERDPGRPTMS